ncbi:MAG: hypothetical protein RL076_1054 [Chloroflexota bacterium]|jgi:hypothetical protein
MRAWNSAWNVPLVTTLIACVLACLVGVGGYALLWPHTIGVTYNQTDDTFYRGIHGRETTSDGIEYQWTTTAAQLTIPRMTWVPMSIVDMVVLDSGRPLVMHIDTTAVALSTTRRVRLLLAQPDAFATTLSIQTPALQTLSDPRNLGVRITRVLVHRIGVDVPAPVWLAMTCVLVTLASLTCNMLGSIRRHAWLGGTVVVVLMCWMIMRDASYATIWVYGVVLTWCTVIAGISLIRRYMPQIPRVVLIGLTITLLIRIIAITYPGFEGHDYLIHAKRLMTMQDQQQITVIDYPYEFNRQPALILPLFYGVTFVITPLLGTSLAMHLLAIWAETLTAAWVWVLLIRWGMPTRTASLASIMLMAMPLSSAVLWWAFFPQIIAHMCLFGMMMSTARRDMPGAWWAGIWCAAIAWTHIGEVMIAVVWYVCVRLYESDRGTRDWWMRWVPIVVIPMSALIVYVPYVRTLWHSTAPSTATLKLASWARLVQIKEGLAVGFAPIPWWTFPVLWGVVWYRFPQVARPWIIATIWWVMVELAISYQVRYIYFGVPLIVCGIAVVLMPLWQQRWAGRLFVGVVVAFIVWTSVSHWHDATLLLHRMRVDGLTH